MYYRMWYTIIVPRKRPTPDGPTRAPSRSAPWMKGDNYHDY
nr:MAG TPA: hypothetical protein [Caudoviricetes sp.]